MIEVTCHRITPPHSRVGRPHTLGVSMRRLAIYVQFQFDPALTINAFTRISVRPNGENATGDDNDQFRNLLCAQISKIVGLVTIRDAKSFDLTSEDGSGIAISLRPEDYVGPEAVTLKGDSRILVL
jgi:hypothetical protein